MTFSDCATDEVSKIMNSLDAEVLHLLKENQTYTREEIASKIGKAVRTVQRSLDRLKETVRL